MTTTTTEKMITLKMLVEKLAIKCLSKFGATVDFLRDIKQLETREG